jgi:hypothetical protein
MIKPAAKKTAAKTVAKKAPVKAAKKPAAPKEQEVMHSMPKEVSEWIERASSTMKHLQNQVATLKEENAQLRAYRRFAESKILGQSFE